MSLKDTNKNTSFRIPENYFENFEARLFETETFKQPKKESTGFAVPNDYFKNLDETILDAVQAESTSVSLWSKSYPYIASAAAILVIAMLVFNFLKNDTVGFEDINLATIETYFEDGLLEIDDDDINTLYLNDKEFSMNFDVDDNLLLEYLDDRIDDDALLIED